VVRHDAEVIANRPSLIGEAASWRVLDLIMCENTKKVTTLIASCDGHDPNPHPGQRVGKTFFNSFLPNDGGPASLSGITSHDCALRRTKMQMERKTMDKKKVTVEQLTELHARQRCRSHRQHSLP
jgi:hypothetical protein